MPALLWSMVVVLWFANLDPAIAPQSPGLFEAPDKPQTF
jgi:hypothetical protein